MKTLVIFGCLSFPLFAGAVSAGTIVGTVTARGPTDAETAGGASNYQSRRYKFAEKIDYTQLQDFVVYIDQIVEGDTARKAGRVVQKEAAFEPHVLPVAVGTAVRWPNEDDIFHNVFSMSETKEFDLGFYKKGKEPELVFDKPGRVDVFCGIHSKMHCIVLVVPNGYFAKADEKGRYLIGDVPAGTYRLRAWHERVPARVVQVVVPETGLVKIDFVLGPAEAPKP